ncbi:MAG: exodeoxyribonuclease III [Planctomycetes bacterium]|nr:exodeoxyribonuclease III [Planctomycetota bacterium]
MLIASWNVNSIRVRLQHLLDWMQQAQPDVVCLQELKLETDNFPFDEIGEAGYEAAAYGQKSYNGVAILSRLPIEEVIEGFPGEEGQSRVIEAVIEGVHVFSVYAPNGQTVGGDKFKYKERFYGALREHLDGLGKPSEPVALCGDFNIAPEERDVWDVSRCSGEIGFHPDELKWLKHFKDWGLHDSFRLINEKPKQFSWWDFRGGGFAKDQGLRIDQIWVSDGLKESVKNAWIDIEPRTWERPSDHTPVLCELEV